ncbi:hypothetical protein F2Q69_00038102 [Brassica cretica]|uniref:Uncharacterized protein n=1 Tax=Brassica cretica TaxID=69181 RepID=A0A8S9SIL8_BRACR|nr:hypothetical protein F2Q69_00038102 [Brassica cretica]
MKEAGVAPNVVTYDAVIDCVGMSGKYDEVFMFKKNMVEKRWLWRQSDESAGSLKKCYWVEIEPPKITDEPRAAHGRTRAGCRRMRAEQDGTRLLPIGFASCFLSGLQAADRDCELVDREHELAVMQTEAEVV